MFFFPLGDSLVSVLQVYANVSTHCSIFIGGLRRKNNWDETLENSLSQSGGGMGCAQVQKQAVKGIDPK
jgi:hypothetical protein